MMYLSMHDEFSCFENERYGLTIWLKSEDKVSDTYKGLSREFLQALQAKAKEIFEDYEEGNNI